jgi:hypothetical protein
LLGFRDDSRTGPAGAAVNCWEGAAQTPTDLWADRVCNPKKGGFAVTLNWTPSSTADGYYVYLNGELIQQIKKPTRTSYVIKLPMNEPVSYALEAYNSIGSGERLTIEDPGCP